MFYIMCVRSVSFSFSVTSKHLWHSRRHSPPRLVHVALVCEESQCLETRASRRPRRLCKSFNERINDVLSDCVYPLKGKVINHSEASHRLFQSPKAKESRKGASFYTLTATIFFFFFLPSADERSLTETNKVNRDCASAGAALHTFHK